MLRVELLGSKCPKAVQAVLALCKAGLETAISLSTSSDCFGVKKEGKGVRVEGFALESGYALLREAGGAALWL